MNRFEYCAPRSTTAAQLYCAVTAPLHGVVVKTEENGYCGESSPVVTT